MKIRTGFVSNSSSTSFMIEDVCYKTTALVANKMLEIIFHDYEEWKMDTTDEKTKAVRTAKEWLEKHPDYNGNIYIPWSCNYSTYLWNVEGVPAAETCNNHYWWDYFDTTDLGEQENRAPGWYLDLTDCKLKPCRYCSRW